jgi:hypothetical protein
MSTTRYATLIGLTLGAIWAISAFRYVIIAALLAAGGYLVGLVLEGRIGIDASGLTGGGRDRTTIR